MKKYLKYILFTIISYIAIPGIVNAANGTIYLAASPKQVTVGNTTTVTVDCRSDVAIGTCEYTIDWDSSKLSLVSGEMSIADVASNASTYKMGIRTYTFKVIASGQSSVTVKSYGMLDWNTDSEMSVALDPTTITGVAASTGTSSSTNQSTNSGSSSSNTSYSTNNNLKSLEIVGQTIDFNKDTTEYNLNIDSSVDKITINATAEDPKSTIAGLGEFTLSLGINKYDIIVTSEKGTTKTYTININVEDENPIKVNVNNKEYTVIKKSSLLTPQEGYENKTITIDGIEIPALYSSITDYTIVALKDSENAEISLFVYDEKTNTYKAYAKLEFNSLTLSIIDTENFKNWEKYEITINDKKIMAFKLNEKSNFSVFYAINDATGDKSFYLYDSTENSAIRYNDEEITYYEDKINKANTIIIALAAATVIFAIALILVAAKKTKKKKRIIKEKLIDEKPVVKDKEIKKDSTKNTIVTTQEVDLEKIELENRLKQKDKKAINKKEKEKKQQEKIEKIVKKESEKDTAIIELDEPKKKRKKSNKNFLDEW